MGVKDFSVRSQHHICIKCYLFPIRKVHLLKHRRPVGPESPRLITLEEYKKKSNLICALLRTILTSSNTFSTSYAT